MVSKAKKPVAVLGSQSTLPPVATEKLKSALEVFVVFLKSFCLLLNVWFWTVTYSITNHLRNFAVFSSIQLSALQYSRVLPGKTKLSPR